MKKIFIMTGLAMLSFSCTAPSKKTKELESRIAELEHLLQQIESQQLSQQQRNQRVDNNVQALVSSLKTLEEHPETPPVASTLELAALAPISLDLIKQEPETQHKAFSQKKLAEGQAIIKKLEAPAEAAPHQEKPRRVDNPLVGQKLPQTRYIGPDGKVYDLNDYYGKKNILLVFMRGYAGQVCIACSAQTAVLARTNEQFHKKDTQIVIVYPGPPSAVPSFIKAINDLESSFELPFPVLLDINLQAVKKFQIEGQLAKPTSLIVDKNSIIQFAYTGARYDDRPPVRNLLSVLDQINASPK